MNRMRTGYAPLVVIVVTFLAAFVWAWQSLADGRRAATVAADDLAACQRLSASVIELSKRPERVAGEGLATAELSRLIESGAAAAGISADSLVRITPEPPRRTEGTAYREESAEIVLRAVTARQTIHFLHAVATGAPGLRPTSLRLVTPAGEENGNTWTAEIRLAQVVYAPRSENKLTGQ